LIVVTKQEILVISLTVFFDAVSQCQWRHTDIIQCLPVCSAY